MEKVKNQKVDEALKVMKTTKLDINNHRKPLTTDHNGHPIIVKRAEPRKLPDIVRSVVGFSEKIEEAKSKLGQSKS